jgi:eukaryotic-like serine/threonine-protein kinase
MDARARTGPLSDPMVGTVLDQRWRLVRRIGSGGNGVVYQGDEVDTGRRFAVKVMAGATADPIGLIRFANEAEAASRLAHPNVVPVRAFGRTAIGMPYLAMDLVEGEPLRAYLNRWRPLAEHRALAILRELMRGLEHAHAHGLIHRDLKPDNVMLDGADGRARILDFGLAIITELGDAGRITEQGTVIGTPIYMAPEQLTGSDLDARTDIFAAGVILYEMMTGCLPFDGDPQAIMMANLAKPAPAFAERSPRIWVSVEIEDLCLRMLAKDSWRRPTSTQVLAELDALVAPKWSRQMAALRVQ